jgi:glucose-1-phosphate cytidylyltransferase
MTALANSKDNQKWALMLCGGLGSRMGSLTDETPKPVLVIHERPIIWYSFWSLYKNGFRNFILPLGYLGHQIKEYITEISKDVDCNIHFTDTGIDTSIADRIKQVCHLIPEEESFFLLNTDTVFDFDINSMYQHHINRNALVTVSTVEVTTPWGMLTVVGDEIVDFDKDRKVQRFVSSHLNDGYGVVHSGLAWIKKSALGYIDFENMSDDFETDLFGEAIREQRMAHFSLEGIWVPIDTPKDLAAMNYRLEFGDYSNSSIKNIYSNIKQSDNIKENYRN